MRTLLTGMLVLLVAGSVVAADWHETKSDKGGFKAAFPEKPEEETASENTPAGKIAIHTWTSESEDGKSAFIVMATDFPKQLVQFSKPQLLLDEARNGATQFLDKGKLRKEEKTKFGKYPARMLTIEGLSEEKPTVCRQRIVLAGPRLYQQILIYEKDAPVSDADSKKFFDSFELLEK